MPTDNASRMLLLLWPNYRFAGQIAAAGSPHDAVAVGGSPYDALGTRDAPDDAPGGARAFDRPRSVTIGTTARRSPHDVVRAAIDSPRCPRAGASVTRRGCTNRSPHDLVASRRSR